MIDLLITSDLIHLETERRNECLFVLLHINSCQAYNETNQGKNLCSYHMLHQKYRHSQKMGKD